MTMQNKLTKQIKQTNKTNQQTSKHWLTIKTIIIYWNLKTKYQLLSDNWTIYLYLWRKKTIAWRNYR